MEQEIDNVTTPEDKPKTEEEVKSQENNESATKVENWKLSSRSKREIRAFTINFAAIVLGIIITFFGQSIIEKSATERKLNSAMIQVKEELLKNRQTVERMQQIECFEQKAFQYVYTHKSDMSKANTDTLSSFGGFLNTVSESSTYSDAYEMLKMSGLATEIENSALLVNIIKTYNDISMAEETFDGYMKRKLELMDIMTKNKQFKDALKDATSMTVNDEYAVYVSLPEGLQYIRTMGYYRNNPTKLYGGLIAQIDSLITSLSQYK